MNQDKNVFWIGNALFWGAFLFSLFFINEGLFHADSVILAQAVEGIYKTGQLHPAVNGRYGIVIINAILYLPFYLLGQNADFLTRFSSVLFYSLSIPVFFIFIKDLFKDHIQGMIAAILLALTPFYLIPNTYGKEHGMSMFFFLFSLVLVNRGGDQKSSHKLVWASVCYMIALSVRESVLFMLPFYVWLYLKPTITTKPLRISIAKEKWNTRLLFSVALPLTIFFSVITTFYLGSIIQRSIHGDELDMVHFVGFFSRNLSLACTDAICSFPTCFFSFVIFGVLIIWQERQYFLLIFFLFWSCLIFVYGNTDGYAARHLDMVILAAHAFVSYFLAWAYRRFRYWAIFILAALISIQLIHIYPMLEFRRHYDSTLRLASFLKATTPPNAVFLTGDEAVFIEYYAKRKTIIYPAGHWERLGGVFHEIEVSMDRQIPVYVIPTPYVYLYGGIISKASFFKASPHGRAILNELIEKGIFKNISPSEVSFQINNQLKGDEIQQIAKGDYDKIWPLLKETRAQCYRRILNRFSVSLAGEILFEGYHHPEMGLQLGMMPIFKLGYLGFSKDEFTTGKSAAALLKLITHDLGKSVPHGSDDIEKLNYLLKSPSPQLGAGLTINEQMKENRLIWEKKYPQECPKLKFE